MQRYNTIYELFTNICEEYEFEGTFLDLYNALCKYNNNYDFWKSIIIDHFNHQKYIDNKSGNKYHRFYYYGFAQRDIKYLDRIFNKITNEEYLQTINYYLTRGIS